MGLVLLIWLAGVAHGLSSIMAWLGFLTVGASIGVIAIRHIYWLDNSGGRGKEENKPDHSLFKRLIIIGMTAWVASTFIPDKKTVYWMAGAYVGSQIVQSETAGKVVDMINVQIDKYIKEMQQEETPAKNEKKESK